MLSSTVYVVPFEYIAAAFGCLNNGIRCNSFRSPQTDCSVRPAPTRDGHHYTAIMFVKSFCRAKETKWREKGERWEIMSVPTRKVPYGLLLFIVAALVIGLRAGYERWPGHAILAAQKVSVQVAKETPPASLAEFKNGFASVIDPALPAVVNVSSTKVVMRQNNIPGFLFKDPLFRQFFGDQLPAPLTRPPDGA